MRLAVVVDLLGFLIFGLLCGNLLRSRRDMLPWSSWMRVFIDMPIANALLQDRVLIRCGVGLWHDDAVAVFVACNGCWSLSGGGDPRGFRV
jgi:hypothetical protein